MFEKEAEEYVKEWIVEEDVNALMQEAYKDGAEFGYNKAKKEDKALIEKMKCCGNCAGFCDSDDVVRFCKDNEYKLWEVKEND